MNHNYRRYSKALSMTAVATVVLFSSNVMAAKPCVTGAGAPQEIIVEVTGAGADPAFKNDFCGAAKGKGSVCNGLNQKPDFKFKLEDASDEDWKFVRLELSGDGTNWPGTLPPGAYSDFLFDSDDGLLTGRPSVDVIADGAQMKVQNNNCHAFTVYYRVVMKNGAGKFVRLHPVIENGGTEFD